MESIEALLAALKNHESGKADMSAQVIPLGSKTSVTRIPLASLTGQSDDSPSDPSEGDNDPDDSDDGDAAQNAKIVDALQTQFPKTYAKIMSDIGTSDDDQQSDAPLDASSMVS